MSILRDGSAPAGRKSYLATLVMQRLNHAPPPSYQNEAMAYGIEMEPEARAAYAFQMNVEVQQVGAIQHPRISMASASPDGLIGDDGLVEIKCPQPAAHLDTLLRGTIAQRYIYQMQFQMACTGRAWCDFVSYDKNWPEPMRLKIIRVPRDSKLITKLEIECVRFLAEVDVALEALQKQYPMLDEAA